jgi:hypothetical protein
MSYWLFCRRCSLCRGLANIKIQKTGAPTGQLCQSYYPLLILALGGRANRFGALGCGWKTTKRYKYQRCIGRTIAAGAFIAMVTSNINTALIR